MFFKGSYQQTMTVPGAPGTRSRASGYDTRPTAMNPLLPQQITFTVGGTASNGDYTFTLVDEDNNEVVVAFTRGAGETNTQIAAGLAARLNAISWANDAFDASNAGAVGTAVGKHPGKTYSWKSVAAPGTGTLLLAESVAAGGSNIAPGAVVVRSASGDPSTGSMDEIRNVTGSDAVTAVWGIAEQVQIPDEIDENGNVDRNIKPGEHASVATKGYFWLETETALSTSDTVYVRFTAGAGETAGHLRNDADGGDAKDMSAYMKVITPATSDSLFAEVSINFAP